MSLGKNAESSQNSPIPVLVFRGSRPCLFVGHTILKVVSHYDFSVIYMTVMGFQNNIAVGFLCLLTE